MFPHRKSFQAEGDEKKPKTLVDRAPVMPQGGVAGFSGVHGIAPNYLLVC